MLALLKMLIGFGLVIFVHELGHFLAARRNGVKVERFAIGFDWPFRLARWKRGDTEYVVGALPLGGYVKMLGQSDTPSQDEDPHPPEDSFQAKSVGQRAQIISAGVIMNFLSAFVLCWFAFVVGFHQSPPVLGSVGYGALGAGLRPGDRLLRIDGSRIDSWDDLFVNYAALPPGERVPFVIRRGERELTFQVPVHRDPAEPFNRPDFGRPLTAQVQTVVVDSAADRGGVKPGDTLLALDGQPLPSWAAFSDLIRRRADTDAKLRVRRVGDEGSTEVDLSVRPGSRAPDEIPKWDLGVAPRDPAVLGLVLPDSPGARAGLREGDRVRAVNGSAVEGWYALWRAVAWDTPEGAEVTLSVDRDGEIVDIRVQPEPAQDWALGTRALSGLGIAAPEAGTLTLAAPEPGSPAERFGLREGDVVTRVTVPVKAAPVGPIGRLIDTLSPSRVEKRSRWVLDEPGWDTLLYAMNSLEEPRFEVTMLRDGQELTVTPTLRENPRPVRIGYLGVGPRVFEEKVRLGPIAALEPSFRKPFQLLEQWVSGIRAMLLQRMSARLVSGPIGILRATYGYAEKSTGDLLVFLALLSVNLAVVNFLPIPITDGGHMVFLAYERLRGRKMDDWVLARFQWAGIVFLLSLLVFATWNDIGMLLAG